jgi:homoserine dehydrogenase
MRNVHKTVGVGLLGCGVVGGGVADLLLRNPEPYAHRVGRPVVLRAVAVRDPARDRDLPSDLLVADPMAVVTDPAIQVVVEVMGGVEPARTLILEALRRGKSVVTANKEVLAKHGREIFAEAQRQGVAVSFEGAVAGGIPLIMPLQRGLAANALSSVQGIINGTTNYILTRMAKEGSTFAAALADAQQLGYAEADPSSDVDGHDAAYKLSLLASLLIGEHVDTEDVPREGISRIAPQDLTYAAELGYVVKLLGIAKRVGDRLEARVHPTMIPTAHPLARIEGVTNAVTVQGDAVGEVTFSGPGAGRMPTASAVVGDLLAVASLLDTPDRLTACIQTETVSPMPLDEVDSAFYLRLRARDVPGVLGAVGTCFGTHQVSVRSFVQHPAEGGDAELVIVTHRVREAAFRAAVREIAAMSAISEIASVIHVEEHA